VYYSVHDQAVERAGSSSNHRLTQFLCDTKFIANQLDLNSGQFKNYYKIPDYLET
jgi:hypothetical protein